MEQNIRNSINIAKKYRAETAANCAQTVFLAFAEKTGVTEQQAFAIGSCFGGGMSVGSVCGAITGALMVLGILYPAVDGETKKANRAITKEFIRRFNEQFNNINCNKLLSAGVLQGTPIATELLDGGKHCELMIYTAIELLWNYLAELEKE